MAYLTNEIADLFFFYRTHTNVHDDGNDYNEISSGLVNAKSQIYDLPIQNEEENVDLELSNNIGCQGKKVKKSFN